MGNGALSPGLMGPEREADHLHLVHNLISEITLHCPICLHGVQLETSLYTFWSCPSMCSIPMYYSYIFITVHLVRKIILSTWTLGLYSFRDYENGIIRIIFRYRRQDVTGGLNIMSEWGTWSLELRLRYKPLGTVRPLYRTDVSYSTENAFYIYNRQICFIIWYLLDHASLT